MDCSRRHQQTIDGIAEAISQYDAPYVALSGGKDSMLMTYLALQADPDIEIIHSTHGAAYLPPHWPEVLVHAVQIMGARNVSTTDVNLIWTRTGHDLALVGLRRAESQRRRARMKRAGNLGEHDEYWPLADWTTEEVWTCTHAHSVPYASLYDDAPISRRMHWATDHYERLEWDRLRYVSDLIPDWVVYVPDPRCASCGALLDADISRGHEPGCDHRTSDNEWISDTEAAATLRRSKAQIRSLVDAGTIRRSDLGLSASDVAAVPPLKQPNRRGKS